MRTTQAVACWTSPLSFALTGKQMENEIAVSEDSHKNICMKLICMAYPLLKEKQKE